MTPTFHNGDLVFFTDANTQSVCSGVVLAYTAESAYTVLIKDPDDEWDVVHVDDSELSHNTSQTAEAFLNLDRPSFAPENIFVVECETQDGPSVELFATPTAVETAHPEFEGLRVLLMEAIADPGEKFEMGTYYVSFRSVRGELKP